MRVGVPTEVKVDESRVALTPAGARELTARGHQVIVQSGAGDGSDLADAAYAATGVTIVPEAADVYEAADLIVKVKEPQRCELSLLRSGHVLFTYLHLAADPELTQALLASGATCIAYETVTDQHGRLPLLTPMSQVAGKLATQAGAVVVERPFGGRGVLLGGVPGVRRGKVVIIGGGVVGLAAAEIAIGLGADTYVLDRSLDRLTELDAILGHCARTLFASRLAIDELIAEADLIIGAVLVRGARAPHVVARSDLRRLKRRAVLVDVSIDQGGCFETSRPTTHRAPTFEVDGVTHYCVANMPAAVPVTSSYALTNATMPYILRLADLDVCSALASDPGFLAGLNIAAGRVTYKTIADEQGLESADPASTLRDIAAGR